MKHITILKRMILLFLTIVLPIILFGSIILTRSSRKLINETLQVQMKETQKFATTLDNDFKRIYNTASSLLTKPELGRLAYTSHVMDTYTIYQKSNALREYINVIKSSSDIIQNVRVYIPALNQAYNANNHEKGSIQSFLPESYESLIHLDTTTPSQIIFYENRLLMLLKTSSQKPAYLVELEFSKEQLKKLFLLQCQQENAFYLFCFNDVCILKNVADNQMSETALSASYQNNIARFSFDGRKYFAFRTNFENIAASYVYIIPASSISYPFHFSSIYSIFFVLLMLLSVFIFFIGATRIIHHPLSQLVHAFQNVENGNLSIRIRESSKSEFHYLYKEFNNMTNHLEHLIDETYNQKMLLQRAEFKQLQAQINPHFLYNSFFMLQRMIKRELYEEALQVSKELGLYFQYITKNNSDSVLLQDEYMHAKIYSNIQSMRFDGRITTQLEPLPKSYSHFSVPRLILQPIIENAYNHGLENKCSDGLLVISFHVHETGLEILMEDNGEDLTDSKLMKIKAILQDSSTIPDTAEITGLSNIYKRIQLFFKNNSTLTVSRSALGGLKVIIFLEKEINHEEIIDC